MRGRSIATALCWLAAAAAASAQTVTDTQGLSFGAFAAQGGGTVTVAPGSGARSASGSVLLIASGPGAAAQFTVTGTADAGYTITLPPNGAVTLSNGSATMAVNAFLGVPSGTGQLGAGGSQFLSVGATLTVGSNQPPGNYTGVFTVEILYQ